MIFKVNYNIIAPYFLKGDKENKENKEDKIENKNDKYQSITLQSDEYTDESLKEFIRLIYYSYHHWILPSHKGVEISDKSLYPYLLHLSVLYDNNILKSLYEIFYFSG